MDSVVVQSFFSSMEMVTSQNLFHPPFRILLTRSWRLLLQMENSSSNIYVSIQACMKRPKTGSLLCLKKFRHELMFPRSFHIKMVNITELIYKIPFSFRPFSHHTITTCSQVAIWFLSFLSPPTHRRPLIFRLSVLSFTCSQMSRAKFPSSFPTPFMYIFSPIIWRSLYFNTIHGTNNERRC